MRRRRAVTAVVLAAGCVALSGCATGGGTGTVHGVVRLTGDAFTVPAGATDPSSTPAGRCIAAAQTQDELAQCTGLATGTSGPACSASDDQAPIARGTEVDVVTTSGKVIGFGRLGTPALTGGDFCSFTFTASDVPKSQKIYGLLVAGQPNIAHFTQAELFGEGPVVTIR